MRDHWQGCAAAQSLSAALFESSRDTPFGNSRTSELLNHTPPRSDTLPEKSTATYPRRHGPRTLLWRAIRWESPLNILERLTDEVVGRSKNGVTQLLVRFENIIAMAPVRTTLFSELDHCPNV